MLKENQNNDTLLLDDVIPLEKEEIKIRISKINRKQTTMISYEDDEKTFKWELPVQFPLGRKVRNIKSSNLLWKGDKSGNKKRGQCLVEGRGTDP